MDDIETISIIFRCTLESGPYINMLATFDVESTIVVAVSSYFHFSLGMGCKTDKIDDPLATLGPSEILWTRFQIDIGMPSIFPFDTVLKSFLVVSVGIPLMFCSRETQVAP